MNFRSRDLLNLAYELDCTLRIPGVCEGGTGEPAHANSATWGKGGAMKAHDFAFASACRACHRELDQGSTLSRLSRYEYWMRGHVETMRQLWARGLIQVRPAATVELQQVGAEQVIVTGDTTITHARYTPKRRRGSQCTTPSKRVKRTEYWQT